MAWYVYSPEDFPSKESGRPYEFIEVAGQKLVLKAKSWTKLQNRYEIFRHEDWQDKPGHRYLIFPDEVAQAINDKYGSRGVIATETEPDNPEAKKLVRQAEDINLKWRRKVVENFEAQLARVRMGKPGRTELTPYETECYEKLGLPAPASIDEIKQKTAPQQQPVINVNLTPELISAIRSMPESEASKLTAGLPSAKPEPLKPKSLDDAKKLVRDAQPGL